MKRILITGENSYIGSNVERYLQQYNAQEGRECYRIDTISQKDVGWENYDFAPYDIVFDVTGIAHADIGKVDEETKKLYYQVNCDLAVQTAKKAKKEGVKQFIYMSSIIVYGDSAPLGQRKRITPQTQPAPANFYGDSKWQAEQQLTPLATDEFQVAILRPPFIYGKGSKGNYPLLAKIAGKTPIFPKVENERSMLYIENLCEFLRLLMESGQGGLYFPQNAMYSNTSDMVKYIAESRGRNLYLWMALNPLVKLAGKCPGKIGRLVNKAFGSLSYERSMSEAFEGYQRYDLRESIERIEADRCDI